MAKRSTSIPAPAGLTLEAIAGLLTEAGLRAQTVPWGDGDGRALLSATGGASFNLVGGQAGEGGALSDVAFVASFQLPRPLPELAEQWNRQRRFARAYMRDGLLVLEMDLLLPKLAPAAQLTLGLEVWNRLVNELIATLRAQTATS